MKNKMKLIFSAALAAALIVLPRANAATANASTNPAPASVGTNANPDATMTALFGDPVIAKGKGFEIKQSELDEVARRLQEPPPPRATRRFRRSR